MKTFFLYGAPGSGKTTLACTAPEPILIIDIDKKADSMFNIEHLVKEGKVEIKKIDSTFSSGTLRSKVLKLNSPQVELPKGLLEIVDVVTELEKECKYKTVVIDSLTTFNEHLKRYVLYTNKDVQLSYKGWDFIQSNYVNFFESLQAINTENLVIIAHERIDKNDKGDSNAKFIYRPLIESSMKDKFGIFFNEIYYCSVNEVQGKPHWQVRTSPTDEIIARTSLKLESIEEPNLSKLLIKGKHNGKSTNSKSTNGKVLNKK